MTLSDLVLMEVVCDSLVHTETASLCSSKFY